VSTELSHAIRIESVTSLDDVSHLARILDLATKDAGDEFNEVMARYSSSLYEEAVTRLSSSIKSKDDYVFEAIEVTADSDGTVLDEKIVDLTHWFVGFIDTPKVDPFEERNRKSETATQDITAPLPSYRWFWLRVEKCVIPHRRQVGVLAMRQDHLTCTEESPDHILNAYLYFIRVKEHFCTLGLSPTF
jgi:hypothetical protein